MSAPPVSIVVVSRERPDALRRCLLGISQLFYHPFEVVVVADPTGCAAIAEHAERAKIVAFDQPNISAARNAGLDAATGEVIAFIDDDAVPEPSWLDHLIAPFANPDIDAAGGWVRGRNGISFQNRSRMVDCCGLHTDPDHTGVEPLLITGKPGFGPRTEGTNMAWRRSTLATLGGFNAAYRFFLDETDLNLRLAAIGGTTALVPLAQVHHGFAASARRATNRVPLDLFEVGASWAAFLARHAPDTSNALAAARDVERKRMWAHAIRGNIWPNAIARRLQEFDAGALDGRTRADRFWEAGAPPPFKRWNAAAPPRTSTALAARWHHRRQAYQSARDAVANGTVVSLFCLSKTTLFHHIRFDDAGFWVQNGGIFGRSDRTDPLVSATRFQPRVAREVAKVSDLREIRSTILIGA